MKKVASLLLTLTLCVGLIGSSAFAKEVEDTGFEEPVVILKNDITNDTVINSYKAASNNDYWANIHKPYYEIVAMKPEMVEAYNKIYNAYANLIEGGGNLKDIQNGIVYGPEVEVYGLTTDEVMSLGYLMFYDTPELYFVSNYMIINGAYNPERKSIKLGIYPEFTYEQTRKECSERIRQRIEEYKSHITGTTDLEIEKQIHDLICVNNPYNSKALFSQSCASVFFRNETVCAGYSEAFMILCNLFNIDAMCVTSNTHQWNQVKLDGIWYSVDLTWDNDKGILNHSYFNISDDTYKLDAKPESHSTERLPWTIVGRPECLYDYSNRPDPNKTQYVYRVYNTLNGDHLFTSQYKEKTLLCDNDTLHIWLGEGISWQSPQISDTPIYRLYNSLYGIHHYTKDKTEKDILVSGGWIDEGIAFYEATEGVDTHRLYNPITGVHHFTTNNLEAFLCVICGWNYEGVGWKSVEY